MTKHTDIDTLSKQISAFKDKHQENASSQEAQSNPLKGFQICVEFLCGIFIGLAIGLFIDRLFSTRPVFFVIFTVFGAFAGVLNAYRYATKENKEA